MAKAALSAAKRSPIFTRRAPFHRALSTAISTLSSSTAFSRTSPKPQCLFSHRLSFNFSSSSNSTLGRERGETDETEDEEESDDWELEEEIEPKLGDGEDGGGIVLNDVAWGERVLSVALEVLPQFEDIDLHAFRVSPKGYIYARLDKLTHEYGCPTAEEINKFVTVYKERLDEIGESGEIPDDLGLQVSSPGAERLLRVPDDLDRFKDIPMCVSFFEDNPDSKRRQQSEKVMLLDSVDVESQQCIWKLANVRENRDVESKGRPLSRKQRDWRLTLSYGSIERVTLYIDSK